MDDQWSTEILKRFEGRKDLGKIGLYRQFFKPQGLAEEDVMKCFEEIEISYNIPIGVLRPEDSLTKLTARVETKNPILWFCWLGRNEFSDQSLMDDLYNRMKENGNFYEWKRINTFGDLLRAWCGKKPNTTDLT